MNISYSDAGGCNTRCEVCPIVTKHLTERHITCGLWSPSWNVVWWHDWCGLRAYFVTWQFNCLGLILSFSHTSINDYIKNVVMTSLWQGKWPCLWLWWWHLVRGWEKIFSTQKGRERERGSSGMIDDCIHLWNRSATSTETCKSKRRMSASGTIISGVFLNAMNWSHLQCGHIFPLQAYQHLSESIASCLFHWTWLGTLQFQLTPSLELAIKHAQWSRCLMTNQDQAMFFWRTTHI
jgi:hypothetical protein